MSVSCSSPLMARQARQSGDVANEILTEYLVVDGVHEAIAVEISGRQRRCESALTRCNVAGQIVRQKHEIVGINRGVAVERSDGRADGLRVRAGRRQEVVVAAVRGADRMR